MHKEENSLRNESPASSPRLNFTNNQEFFKKPFSRYCLDYKTMQDSQLCLQKNLQFLWYTKKSIEWTDREKPSGSLKIQEKAGSRQENEFLLNSQEHYKQTSFWRWSSVDWWEHRSVRFSIEIERFQDPIGTFYRKERHRCKAVNCRFQKQLKTQKQSITANQLRDSEECKDLKTQRNHLSKNSSSMSCVLFLNDGTCAQTRTV